MSVSSSNAEKLFIKKCDRCGKDVCVPHINASVNDEYAYHRDTECIECTDIVTKSVPNQSFEHAFRKWQILKYRQIPQRICKCGTKEAKIDLTNKKQTWEDEKRWKKWFTIDIVCTVEDNTQFFIEVKNTHACAKRKLSFFKRYDINWMEIDINGNYLRGNYSCPNC